MVASAPRCVKCQDAAQSHRFGELRDERENLSFSFGVLLMATAFRFAVLFVPDGLHTSVRYGTYVGIYVMPSSIRT